MKKWSVCFSSRRTKSVMLISSWRDWYCPWKAFGITFVSIILSSLTLLDMGWTYRYAICTVNFDSVMHGSDQTKGAIPHFLSLCEHINNFCSSQNTHLVLSDLLSNQYSNYCPSFFFVLSVKLFVVGLQLIKMNGVDRIFAFHFVTSRCIILLGDPCRQFIVLRVYDAGATVLCNGNYHKVLKTDWLFSQDCNADIYWFSGSNFH